MTSKNQIRKVIHLIARGPKSNAINDALSAVLPTLSTKDLESASNTIEKVIEKAPVMLGNDLNSPVLNLMSTVVSSLKDSKDKTNKKTTPPPKQVTEPHVAAKAEAPAKDTTMPIPIDQSSPPPESKEPTQTSPPEVISSTPESGYAKDTYISDDPTPKAKDEKDNTGPKNKQDNSTPKKEDSTSLENPQVLQNLIEEPTREEPVKELAKEAPEKEAPVQVAPEKGVPVQEAALKEGSNHQETEAAKEDAGDKLDKGTVYDPQTSQTALTDQTGNPTLTKTEGQNAIQGYSQSIYATQEIQSIPTIEHSRPTMGPGALSAILITVIMLTGALIVFAFLRCKKRQSVSSVLMFDSASQSQPKPELADFNPETPKPRNRSHTSINPLMREFYGFPIPGYLERKSENKNKKKGSVAENHNHSFV